MLEILGVVLLTRWAREACTANGRTAWLSAAVPIAWFTAEIIAAVVLQWWYARTQKAAGVLR